MALTKSLGKLLKAVVRPVERSAKVADAPAAEENDTSSEASKEAQKEKGKGTEPPPPTYVWGEAAGGPTGGAPASGKPAAPEAAGARRRRGDPVEVKAVAKGRKQIRSCDELTRGYVLGAEVARSHHSGVEVRNARCLATGTAVIVKTRQKKDFSADTVQEEEWRATMDLLLNLPRSPYIARIHEVLAARDCYHVVMERCGGSDLCDTLMGKRGLPVPEVREVLKQVLLGLSELHERGCIHRDIKLENIMLDRTPAPEATNDSMGDLAEMRVKIVDFDTAEPLSRAATDSAAGSASGKRIWGTDQYLAPETYAGDYSKASDVFAVGVVGFALLTGNFPFSESVFAVEPPAEIVGTPESLEVQSRLVSAEVDWSHPVFKEHRLARDLLQRMISVERSHRPTARSAILHTWISGPTAEVSSEGAMAPSFSKLRLTACDPAVSGIR